MIIVMKPQATEKDLEEVVKRIENMGYHAHISKGEQRTIIGAIGDERGKARLQALESLPGVENIVPILQPYKLAGREVKPENTIVRVNGVEIGGDKVVIMAGPCSVESEEQLMEVARHVKSHGASILRGGAYKPRTSPYAFQGLEISGLKLLAMVKERVKIPTVTEVINPEHVEMVAEYVDVLQVGARNVQNFALLKKVGESGKPVLLKRGMATTVKEFLMSAEYILSEGNNNVILCERGIRTFETSTRFTLDLNAIPVIKKLSHLPIIVDPSHGTGHWEYVTPMAKAAIASGADGLIVEVHPNPEEALSDGVQSLKLAKFERMMEELKPLIQAIGRKI